MKEEILKVVARQICEDLSEAIIVGVKEYEEDFPYTIACVNFISELKENGVKVNLRVFADCQDIFDNMYREFSRYLAR